MIELIVTYNQSSSTSFLKTSFPGRMWTLQMPLETIQYLLF